MPEDISAGDVVRFWTEETPESAWYAVDPDLDDRIRDRFGAAWDHAWIGGHADWLGTRDGVLGYLILTDQFPRNMFRGDARSYATDPHARAAAASALSRGLDRTMPPRLRQFVYLPFMHSELLVDQDRAVRLYTARTGDAPDRALHAVAHRETIRRFGRFPARNAALGRDTTPDEQAYLDQGGYGAVVRATRARMGLPAQGG